MRTCIAPEGSDQNLVGGGGGEEEEEGVVNHVILSKKLCIIMSNLGKFWSYECSELLANSSNRQKCFYSIINIISNNLWHCKNVAHPINSNKSSHLFKI